MLPAVGSARPPSPSPSMIMRSHRVRFLPPQALITTARRRKTAARRATRIRRRAVAPNAAPRATAGLHPGAKSPSSCGPRRSRGRRGSRLGTRRRDAHRDVHAHQLVDAALRGLDPRGGNVDQRAAEGHRRGGDEDAEIVLAAEADWRLRREQCQDGGAGLAAEEAPRGGSCFSGCRRSWCRRWRRSGWTRRRRWR